MGVPNEHGQQRRRKVRVLTPPHLDESPFACHSLQDKSPAERDVLLQKTVDADKERQARNIVRREWQSTSMVSADHMDIEDRCRLTARASAVKQERQKAERHWSKRVPVEDERTWWRR